MTSPQIGAMSDHRVLGVARAFGFIFAGALVSTMAFAMIPNQFFIVSEKAVVNAPVNLITSPIYGRIDDIRLEVGAAVQPGFVAAVMSNPNQDQTSVVGLRLEKLDIEERLNNELAALDQRRDRLTLIDVQIADVKRGALEELASIVESANSNVQYFQAKVNEQQALVDRQQTLLDRGVIKPESIAPLLQQKAAAEFELQGAQGELKRQELLRSLFEQGIFTGGQSATNILSLELQRKTLAVDVEEAETEISQMQRRLAELTQLLDGEQNRLGGIGAAEVKVEASGQVVSVEAAYGDFLTQGQPIARSLDCNEAFVAAVYSSRDVADIEIGTPSLVNIRSIGQQRHGRVSKIVRYFGKGGDDRYFEELPEAEGHEVYVLVELDSEAEDGEGAGLVETDQSKFFGCHVGEDVVVSLGEPMIEKLVRYSTDVAALVGPYLGLDTVLSTAQASDDPQDATTATVARVTY
ncbi:HlyD family efflux transporter periplasmic adaptor subunit [Georhizobium sp. MAB10]|uniref:HlyD family efflux transporter periplasmic adaptor subunit n=1 Tax=Georhizobium sp. MAB10 TaxID=3028319 RepID=UPI003855CE9C